MMNDRMVNNEDLKGLGKTIKGPITKDMLSNMTVNQVAEDMKSVLDAEEDNEDQASPLPKIQLQSKLVINQPPQRDSSRIDSYKKSGKQSQAEINKQRKRQSALEKANNNDGVEPWIDNKKEERKQQSVLSFAVLNASDDEGPAQDKVNDSHE